METSFRRTVGCAVGILLLIPTMGYSILGIGDVVVDPLNLAQNTLTAARSFYLILMR